LTTDELEQAQHHHVQRRRDVSIEQHRPSTATTSSLHDEQSIALTHRSTDVIGGSELDLLMRYRRLLRRISLVDRQHDEATSKSSDDRLRWYATTSRALSRSLRPVILENSKSFV
jgi:hypothetical protein